MKKILTTLAILACLASNLFAQELPKSKVVFFRTSDFFEFRHGFNVFNDTTKMIRLWPNTFEVLEVDSKMTKFWAKTEVKTNFKIDLRPNHIYFVRGGLDPGVFMGRPRFEVLTIDEFRNVFAKKKSLRRKFKELGYESVDDFIKAYEGLNFTNL